MLKYLAILKSQYDICNFNGFGFINEERCLTENHNFVERQKVMQAIYIYIYRYIYIYI